MAGITLTQAQAQLDLWITADAAVSKGQSYKLSSGGTERQLTQVDADLITGKIKFWEKRVLKLTRGGLAVKFGTPI